MNFGKRKRTTQSGTDAGAGETPGEWSSGAVVADDLISLEARWVLAWLREEEESNEHLTLSRIRADH